MLVACPDGIVATGADGRVTLYTGASEAIFGFDPIQVLDHHFTMLFGEGDARSLLQQELLERGKAVDVEVPGHHCDGSRFFAAVSAAVIRDRYGDVIGTFMYIRDHTNVRTIEDALRTKNSQLNHLVAKLDHMARHDQLTMLLNRGFAVEAAEDALLASGLEDVAMGVALLDLDHFKMVNDSYGHLVGDVVLARVAAVLRKATRQGDIVARFGGEEFVAFLPGADLDAVVRFAERVRDALEHARIPVSDEIAVTMTVSAGVAAIPSCADSLNEAIRIADDRLYAAKRAGRNRVVHTDTNERRSAA
jgi:diguanylate cyclase (GGDEF)-like protein/PAS domain S-box-containing protein